MRLIDRVAGTHGPTRVELDGRIYELPGAADYAGRVEEYPLRYVLDDNVEAATQALIGEWPDLLRPEDPALRLPAEKFWLEWRDPPIAEGRCRSGILVDASSDGRSGTLRSFWDDNEGADIAQVTVHLDLDTRSMASGSATSFALSRVQPARSDLDNHITLEFDEAWWAFFLQQGEAEARQAMVQSAEMVWRDVYRLLAFSRLLSMRLNMQEKFINRTKLNKARAKSKKRPLLDHIEISMELGHDRASGVSAPGGGRAASRLHTVRGHLVRRDDNLFWRATHLRGDRFSSNILTRTVTVRSKSKPV